MYSSLPTFIIGFHGCDKSVGMKVLNGKEYLQASNNDYDWLGHGIYFWENNPERAYQYAISLLKKPIRGTPKILDPFVIGAIIDLGYCLNLLDSKYLEYIAEGYELLKLVYGKVNRPVPENRLSSPDGDILLRNLDCAVINLIPTYRKKRKQKEFDSVRAVFVEGKELYPNAGFQEKNHIQICVRNINCIKGYFLPIKEDSSYPMP